MRKMGSQFVLCLILLSFAQIGTYILQVNSSSWVRNITFRGSILPYWMPGFAQDLYRTKYEITTTSDWTILSISSFQSHVAAYIKVIERSNATVLNTRWDRKSIYVYKSAYDTSRISIEVTLLIAGLALGSPITYNITKGSIGNTTAIVLNYNTANEFVVANRTNHLSGGDENPLIFDANSEDLIEGGPVKIEFNKQSRKVLAFYYPWFGVPWGPQGRWLGWSGYGHDPDVIVNGYRDIGTSHYPLLDVYDSWNTSLIDCHLQWAKESMIDCLACSWWSINHTEDTALRYILGNCLNMNISITVLYETGKTSSLSRQEALKVVAEDLTYILGQYSNAPPFLRINAHPAIFIYSADLFDVNEWKSVLDKVKTSFNATFLADTWNTDYLWVFDGLFRYNPIEIEEQILRSRYEQASLYTHAWGLLTGDSNKKIFVATVLPGYDDTRIRNPGIYVPRDSGLLYENQWNMAVSSAPDLVAITSFNEWKEGTEIEPSIELGKHYLNATAIFSSDFKGG